MDYTINLGTAGWGVWHSPDAGKSWLRHRAPFPLNSRIQALAVDPVNPRTLFAGTRPAAVYRSRDGGRRWERLDLGAATECAIGTPFVTRVLVDPDDRRTVWAGVEIDGVFRSVDAGDTWTRAVRGLSDLDVHDMAIARTSPPRVFVSTNAEVFWSDDRGETWTPIGVKTKWPLPYARGIVVKPDDPRVLFAGCGETTTGETGGVLRSF